MWISMNYIQWIIFLEDDFTEHKISLLYYIKICFMSLPYVLN